MPAGWNKARWVAAALLPSLVARAESHWAQLAEHLARRDKRPDLRAAETAARQAVETAAFLGICQRRGLLEPGSLEGLPESLTERFGPGLFAAALPTEDEPLRRVLRGLTAETARAGPDTPVDLLGRIHESLLGLRLRRARDGGLKVRQSTAARKAAGVYYTPECVTRYVVRHTVGRLLEGHAPQPKQPANTGRSPAIHARDLTILDPACGCGSFLLAACRRLLEEDRPGGTPARHLVGVDVDPEAVLVTRRSLWLEILAHGGSKPARKTRVPDDAAARVVLDDLTDNVQCGDALAGPALRPLEGRVDAVIGNPPYRRELDTKHLLDRVAATGFGRRWRTARMDLWYYFLHRGLELLRPGGMLAFIVGAYWTAGRGAEKLIRALRESAHVEEIFCLDDLPVFAGISGRHMILRLSKGRRDAPTTIRRVSSPLPLAGEGPGVRGGGDADGCPWDTSASGATRPHPNPLPHTGEGAGLEEVFGGAAPLVVYRKTAGQLFRAGHVDLEPPADELLARLDRFTPLGKLGKVRQGIAENPAAMTRKINARYGGRWRIGEGVFALTPDELARLGLPEHEADLVRPYHDLCDLGRYHLADEPSLRLVYATRDTCPDIDAFPVLRAHLERFRPALEARRETRRGARPWWQLHWPRDEALWRRPKVIAVQMARRPSFVPAARPVYVSFSVNVFVPDDTTREHVNYFAAVLNSRLLWHWFCHHAKRRGVGLEINGGVLARAPIRPIDFGEPAQRQLHDRLVEMVARMTALCSKRGHVPPEGAMPLDRRIDDAVCELYGLTATFSGRRYVGP